MKRPSVGFLGLGFMGHPMAVNILASGCRLTVLAHKKREAIEDLVEKGAREAANLTELTAASDVIVLCVAGAEQVDDIIRRPAGIGDSANAGTLVIDCTTSQPETIVRLAADYPELVFIDCPLGRSPKEAWEGRLSVMVGASKADLAAARPVISAFADTIQHVGPRGSGHTLKLVNNMVSLGYAALYAEAIVMTQKAGIPLSAFDDLVSSSRMDCAFFQTFMGWARNGDATSHKFALSSADHALSQAISQARAAGLDLPVLNAVGRIFHEVTESGYGAANLPELPSAVAEHFGVAINPIAAKDQD